MPVAHNAGGALCAASGYRAERAGGGPTGTGVNINCKHARRGPAQRTPCPSCARHCHKNASTHKPGTKECTRGAGRGTPQHLQARDTVPECTVCQAATTGGVPANCAVQPALPYASMTFSCINPTFPETGQLHATIVQLLLAGGLNRPHSASQKIAAVTWPNQAIIVQNTCCCIRAAPPCPARRTLRPLTPRPAHHTLRPFTRRTAHGGTWAQAGRRYHGLSCRCIIVHMAF